MRLLAVAIFAIGAVTAGTVHGADVSYYGIFKERNFEQTNDVPALVASNGFSFSAAVIVTAGGVVNAAGVQLGAGGIVHPLAKVDGYSDWFFRSEFSSQAELDAAFPSVGGYILTMHAAVDGVRSPQLSLAAGMYPPAPRVQNLAAAGDVDAASGFALSWDSFAGGTTNDYIQFSLTDETSAVVFLSPILGNPGALNGTSTTITIPSGTLQPGRSYTAAIAFARITVDFANIVFVYPNVPGFSAFVSQTHFPMVTRPLVASQAPRLTVVGADAATGMTVSFETEIGASYRLQAATNVASPNWMDLLTTNAASTNVVYTDGAPSTVPARVYRIVSP